MFVCFTCNNIDPDRGSTGLHSSPSEDWLCCWAARGAEEDSLCYDSALDTVTVQIHWICTWSIEARWLSRKLVGWYKHRCLPCWLGVIRYHTPPDHSTGMCGASPCTWIQHAAQTSNTECRNVLQQDCLITKVPTKDLASPTHTHTSYEHSTELIRHLWRFPCSLLSCRMNDTDHEHLCLLWHDIKFNCWHESNCIMSAYRWCQLGLEDFRHTAFRIHVSASMMELYYQQTIPFVSLTLAMRRRPLMIGQVFFATRIMLGGFNLAFNILVQILLSHPGRGAPRTLMTKLHDARQNTSQPNQPEIQFSHLGSTNLGT